MRYFEANWCSLNWTPWISFTTKEKWKLIPKETGVYRVRPSGTSIIAYIGETGRQLRVRLGSLRRGTLAELMPFNDPHTAAPNLWAWRQEQNWDYECSTAVFEKPRAERKALECCLLWKYRLERGESTLCNYGRFHKNYRKSTNRSKKRRGYRLPEPLPNASWGPSLPALRLKGIPVDENWMGIQWSKTVFLNHEAAVQIPNIIALYKILDPTDNSLKYIGETKNLRNRFRQHCRNFKNSELLFSFSKQPTSIEGYQLNELETDLIGAYYYQTSQAPENQFSNITVRLVNPAQMDKVKKPT